MARLKELKVWKNRGLNWVRLEFTAGKKADPIHCPTGIIFQEGYPTSREAERRAEQLRAMFQRDLIEEERFRSHC